MLVTRTLFAKSIMTASCIIFLFILSVSIAKSQGCLIPDTYTRPHFQEGIIYYYFENIPESPERNQIVTAFNNWNIALLSNPACPNVQFRQSFFTNGVKVKYGNVELGNARFDPGQENFGTIQTGTITINKDYEFNGQLYYDPMVDGYGTIFTKAAMHEIGHGLGLNHYSSGHPNGCTDQINKSSVMNNGCGINDNGTYLTNIFGQV